MHYKASVAKTTTTTTCLHIARKCGYGICTKIRLKELKRVDKYLHK